MIKLLFCLCGLAATGMAVLLGGDAIPHAVLSGLGSVFSVTALYLARRDAPRCLWLAAAAFAILFVLNYPVQYILTGLMYQSAEWASLLRSLSLRPIQAAWSEQMPVLCEMNLALAFLCGGLTILLLTLRGHARTQNLSRQWSRQGLAALFVSSVAVLAAGVALQLVSGVGALTSDRSSEFRFEGFLYHTLVTFIPILLLSIHWVAATEHWHFVSRIALAAFIVLALVETAMMSSRGYVALQMTSVVLLYLWNSFRWRIAWFVVLVTLGASVALYPAMTSVRILRSNLGFSPLESLRLALDTLEAEEIGRSGILLVSRFVGYTSYLVTVQYASETFDWSRMGIWETLTLRNSSLTRWYTESVAGYGVGVRGHFSSPGIMGVGRALGGKAWALILPALVACAGASSVLFVAKRAGPLGEVAPVVWLANSLFVFNEGTLDLGFIRLSLTLGGLLLSGILLRAFAAKTAHAA